MTVQDSAKQQLKEMEKRRKELNKIFGVHKKRIDEILREMKSKGLNYKTHKDDPRFIELDTEAQEIFKINNRYIKELTDMAQSLHPKK